MGGGEQGQMVKKNNYKWLKWEGLRWLVICKKVISRKA